MIEFDQFAVTFDAPFSSNSTERIYSLIKSKIGDKQLYVVVTHGHKNHIGGLRAYIHKGVKILATKTLEPFINKMATINLALRPDSLALQPANPQIEFIDQRKSFDDGTTQLDLINIGPVGHADDMIIAYLPKQKMVYTVDIFNFSSTALPGFRLSITVNDSVSMTCTTSFRGWAKLTQT